MWIFQGFNSRQFSVNQRRRDSTVNTVGFRTMCIQFLHISYNKNSQSCLPPVESPGKNKTEIYHWHKILFSIWLIEQIILNRAKFFRFTHVFDLIRISLFWCKLLYLSFLKFKENNGIFLGLSNINSLLRCNSNSCIYLSVCMCSKSSSTILIAKDRLVHLRKEMACEMFKLISNILEVVQTLFFKTVYNLQSAGRNSFAHTSNPVRYSNLGWEYITGQNNSTPSKLTVLVWIMTGICLTEENLWKQYEYLIRYVRQESYDFKSTSLSWFYGWSRRAHSQSLEQTKKFDRAWVSHRLFSFSRGTRRTMCCILQMFSLSY